MMACPHSDTLLVEQLANLLRLVARHDKGESTGAMTRVTNQL
jgi:hypothetical protein